MLETSHPPKDMVIGVNHQKQVADGNMNFLGGFGVGAKADGGGTKDGTDVVGPLNPILGVPGNLVLVREDGSANVDPLLSPMSTIMSLQ